MPRPLIAAPCLVFAAAFLLAACARDRRSHAGAAAPGGEPGAAAWTARSHPDTIAAWARARCGGGGQGRRRECYERALLSLLDSVGVGNTMAVLDRVAAQIGRAHV
jgi:hypothetical protein